MSNIENEHHITIDSQLAASSKPSLKTATGEKLLQKQKSLRQKTSQLGARLASPTQWNEKASAWLPSQSYRKFKIIAKRNFGPRTAKRRYRDTLNWTSRTFVDKKIERLFFVPTQTHIPLAELTIDSPNRQHAYDYRTIPVSVFHKAMTLLPVSPHAMQFIDIGAGRGRSVILASGYEFESICGVEFAKELHDDACMNRAQFPRPYMKCRNIDLFHMDFTDFEIPRQNQVFFAHRPFDIEMYKKAIAHIKASYIDAPREIYLIVVEPPRSGELPRLMKAAGIFENISPSGLGIFKRHFIDLYPTEIYKTRFRSVT